MPVLKSSSRRGAKPRAALVEPLVAAAKPKRVKLPKPVDRDTMVEIFRRFQAANPEPKGELEHVNAFTLLVAVVLSAQSTDAGVNKATRTLFRRRRHAAQDAGPRRGPRARAYQDDQLPQHQGEERHRPVAPPRRGFRRRGAQGYRGTARRFRASGTRPRASSSTSRSGLPASPWTRISSASRTASRFVRTKTPRETQDALERIVPERIPPQRPSLADPARALRVQGSQARMRRCLINDLCRYPDKTA